MSNEYRLVGVGNAELVAGLSKVVQQSNSLTAQVLAYLVELDERRLHLELGFSSLFAYCVEGLGMSEGTAGRRVTATRVCRRFPEVFQRIARGELHLCALCALAPHLNEQNAAELFDASKGQTRRQIEELLAARFPRPDVREQIRRLPARGHRLMSAATTGAFVEQTLLPPRAVDAPDDAKTYEDPASVDSEVPETRAKQAPTHVEGACQPPAIDVRPGPRPRELEPLSAGRFGVHFTADTELRELIERARALASHRIPNGDLAGLMKLMVASFVRQEEKRRFGIEARRPGSALAAKRSHRTAQVTHQTSRVSHWTARVSHWTARASHWTAQVSHRTAQASHWTPGVGRRASRNRQLRQAELQSRRAGVKRRLTDLFLCHPVSERRAVT